jgi:hypothetical protein
MEGELVYSSILGCEFEIEMRLFLKWEILVIGVISTSTTGGIAAL